MTVQTEDGKQENTKLAGIGKRAKYRPETVFDNIGHVIDLNLLKNCYAQLDGRKAVGRDGVTKAQYGEDLEGNLQDLLNRLRKGSYLPQASRQVEIPKEDGSSRPLAISCFEDKLVQQAVSQILTALYEPDFLPISYGYREGKRAHDALRALMKLSNGNPAGGTLEIDLRRYFNTIPHEQLMEIVQEKISDRWFLRLLRKLLRSPIEAKGEIRLNLLGCPQGSIISPILSNIYLHKVVDVWFAEISKSHIRGGAGMVRFADDMVFVFKHHEEAERFARVLPKRLEKYGLMLHEEKSSLIRTGKKVAAEAERLGKRIPTYKFLGFTCYWGKSRHGEWRFKYKSRSDRMTGKLKGLRKFLKEHLSKDTLETLRQVKRVVIGWVNYHAISDNQRQVNNFLTLSQRALFRWLSRKGGKKRPSWKRFNALMKRIDFPKSFKTTSMFKVC